jgi:hypothetical protein
MQKNLILRSSYDFQKLSFTEMAHANFIGWRCDWNQTIYVEKSRDGICGPIDIDRVFEYALRGDIPWEILTPSEIVGFRMKQ